MRKKIFLIFLIVFTVAISNFHRLIGLAAEPILEAKLTSLFGMPVQFGALEANPFTGRVKASRVAFTNQEGFSPGPHLDIEEMEFYIDFLKLRQKHVLIHQLQLKRPLYFIESVPYGKKDSVSNIGTWVQHIKKKKGTGSGSGPRKWKVTILDISIEDGAFIFRKAERKKKGKRFLFHNLNGSLKGFEWPTPDPAYLRQEVQLKGVFGDEKAPMRLKGRANFATSQVSFNIRAEIKNGAVEKHPFLWQGLPFKVTDGKFFLKTKMVCVKRQLEVDSTLILNALQLDPKKTPATLLWGLPFMASLKFLQSQKTIVLQVPVKGDITDLRFGFANAFRKAFQEALKRHTRTGAEMIRSVPGKLAEQTEGFVAGAQTKVIGGIGKISSTIVKNIPPLPSLPAPAETKPAKKETPNA